MNFRNLLTINAILFLAFGIGFLVFPSGLLSLFGVRSEPGTILATQLYAGLLVAVGLLSWLFRDVSELKAIQALQISFMIAFASNAIVHFSASLAGVLNGLGWSAVIIYLLLSAGYAYFYLTGLRR